LTYNIIKGPRSLSYKRQVQKISTVFSFMGGLIGAVLAVMFIFNAYTSYSLELSIASGIFSKPRQPDEQAPD
jgi:hypothetical protein